MKHGIVGAAGLVLLVCAFARPAEACGGFFCNRPPPDGTLPIAQAAENVLFVLDRDPATGAGTVEAHIQVLYTGPASEFSWIVPVTAVPTVAVGADILFDRIEPPTRPSFNVSYQTRETAAAFRAWGRAAAALRRGAATAPVSARSPTPGSAAWTCSAGQRRAVRIRRHPSRGRRHAAHLADHRRLLRLAGERVADRRVRRRPVLVRRAAAPAWRDTSAIRPIVLRMAAVEACLPLKLTAIAATPDLRINVWVLAAARAVPINYAEITINQAKLDWFNAGRNYDQLLKEAANEAQGNAFAVEYAKPARDSLTWFTVPASARTELASARTPSDFMNALARAGLQPTGSVLQVLRKHIPLPAALAARGVSESVFYANLSQFWFSDTAAFAPFDPAAAAAEIDTEVLMPMADYGRLFDRSGRLTRLATFISPEEMTSDPVFVPNPSLPDLAPQHLAVARVMCGDGAQACQAPVRLRTEDGRDVHFRATSCMQYERADDLERLPAADVAWQRDADGEGRIVVDNRAEIMTALKAHNDAIPVEEGGGCGCAVGGTPGVLVGLMLAASGLALSWRRRRRR